MVRSLPRSCICLSWLLTMLSRSSSSLIFSSLALGVGRGILDARDLPVAPVLKRLRRRRVVAVYVDDHLNSPSAADTFGLAAALRLLFRRRLEVRLRRPDRSGHHDLAAHQQPRGAQQGGAGHVLRIGRIDLDLDAELAGRMFDRYVLDVARPAPSAMPCVTEPSSTHAVATVTAASTPIASWQTCGMKLRVRDAAAGAGRRSASSSDSSWP